MAEKKKKIKKRDKNLKNNTFGFILMSQSQFPWKCNINFRACSFPANLLILAQHAKGAL